MSEKRSQGRYITIQITYLGGELPMQEIPVAVLLRCRAAVLQDYSFAGVLGGCAAGLQRNVAASTQGF